MKKLIFDTGIEEYEINGGKILRFNPADINIYNRLINAKDKIVQIESQMVEKAKAASDEKMGETVVALLAEADAEMKKLLGEVFGGVNDFNDIFEGVNVMSVAKNGERIITNFLVSVTPILAAGAKRTAREQSAIDVSAVKSNRAQRRAQK